MSCYICSPTCDNCKPKTIVCPTCGLMSLLDLPKCPKCHNEWPQDAVDEVWKQWRIKHGAAHEKSKSQPAE